VIGDVTDAKTVSRALDGCEGGLHAAAVVELRPGRAQDVLRTNARGLELVVGGAHERGLRRIVHVSSASALFAPGGPPIRAGAPLASARGAYGRSKSEGERRVRQLRDAGAAIYSTFPPAVVGPDDPGLSEGNRAIRGFVRDAVVLTSSGFQLVDVRDLAALHAALFHADAAPGEYVVAGHYLGWRALADQLDRLTGRRVRRVPLPGAALRAMGRLGEWIGRVVPLPLPLGVEATDYATLWPGAIDSPALQALGLGYRSAERTLSDTLRWLVRAGELAPAQIGRLHQAPPAR